MRVEKNVKGLILQLKAARPLNDELSNSLMENFGHMATQIVKNEAKNMSSTCGSRQGRLLHGGSGGRRPPALYSRGQAGGKICPF